MSALSQEIKQAGFMVHSKAIEVHGICAKCQNLSGDQKLITYNFLCVINNVCNMLCYNIP